MTDQPEKVYSGMIVNFGKGDGGKGNGFGFVEAADRSIPDAYFNMPMLERQGFPIPNDETKLNWLRVKYTVTVMPDGALRVATIQLDGDMNYDVRSDWQGAAPEVGARNAEAPTDQQHNNISGQVKWFDAIKGFGFIIPDDGGDDVFVYIQTLGNRTITKGDAVTFDRSPNPRKGREGSWMASTIHTINGKAPIPKNIPADEIHTLTLDIREFESGLQLVLPPPYQQLSIPFDLKRDADVFASYPEHRINSNNPLEDGERLSGIRVWIKQNGEAMLLPKHYKPLVAKRPTHNRTPGAGRPEGNDGQK